jgi:hypothetical protein
VTRRDCLCRNGFSSHGPGYEPFVHFRAGLSRSSPAQPARKSGYSKGGGSELLIFVPRADQCMAGYGCDEDCLQISCLERDNQEVAHNDSGVPYL